VSANNQKVRTPIEQNTFETQQHFTQRRTGRAGRKFQAHLWLGKVQRLKIRAHLEIVSMWSDIDQGFLMFLAQDAADNRSLNEIRIRINQGCDLHNQLRPPEQTRSRYRVSASEHGQISPLNVRVVVRTRKSLGQVSIVQLPLHFARPQTVLR
jgi:hypothetical protein